MLYLKSAVIAKATKLHSADSTGCHVPESSTDSTGCHVPESFLKTYCTAKYHKTQNWKPKGDKYPMTAFNL